MSKKEHKYKREKHGIGIEGALLIGGMINDLNEFIRNKYQLAS